MSDTITGKVEAVSKPNAGGYCAMKIGDSWYGMAKKGPVPANKDDTVTFSFYLKDGKYKTVKGEINKQNSTVQGTTGPAKSAYQAKDDYWAAKEKHDKEVVQPRIIYLAAYERAVQFAQFAVANGAIPSLVNAKPNDRLSVLTSFVDELTNNIILKANDTKEGEKAKAAFKAAVTPTEAEQTEEAAEENWE